MTNKQQFFCVPMETLQAGLSAGAMKALFALLSFRNHQTGQCNPGFEKLCERLEGASRRSVFRWLGELRQRGILDTKGHWGVRSYVFHMEYTAGTGAKNGNSQVPKMAFTGAKNGTCRVALPYMNRELNRERNTDAAVPSEGLRKPAKPAAATTPTSSSKNQEHERCAAPPVNTQMAHPASPQLDFDLQPCDPIHEQAVALVDELHAVHPQPGLPDKAVGEAEKILRVADDPAAIVELIRANHASWKAHWEMLRPGQFVPQLWRWFRDGEWKRTVGKPVRHETWYEKQQQKQVSPEMMAMFDKDVERFHAKSRRFAGA